MDLWEVKDLPFTDAAVGPVRVVLAEERWTERQRRAGHTQRVARHEAAAIQAWLLILVLGFNLVEVFARLHSKLWRSCAPCGAVENFAGTVL